MKCVISLAQLKIIPGDISGNLKKAGAYLLEAKRKEAGLICFPEMWTTGFAWDTIERDPTQHGQTISQVGALAKKHSLWISGSMPTTRSSGGVSNSLVLFNPQGEIVSCYHKTHLFPPFHEDRHLQAGDELVVAETPWGRTGFAICYDLRFPEIFQNYAQQEVDLLIIAAAFPLERIDQWKELIVARAIETQSTIIATNRVGQEHLTGAAATIYGGTSLVVNPQGKILAEGGQENENMLTVSL